MFEFNLSKAVNSIPIGKIQKKDIQACLKDITDSKFLESDEVHKLIGLCLRYWTPSSKKPRDNFDWATLACSCDDTRPKMLHPWIRKNYLIATDVHRMHLVPNIYQENINGFAFIDKKLRQLIETNLEPPPVEPFLRIRDERIKLDAEIFKLSDFKHIDQDIICIPSKIGDIHVDQKYINEVYSIYDEFKCYPGKDILDVLIFESLNKDQLCFLMPMRS